MGIENTYQQQRGPVEPSFPGSQFRQMPNLPKSLKPEEKKYLLAVERGDTAAVKRMLIRARRDPSFLNIDCVDPLGRGGLVMAIDAEDLPMVELLVVMGVKTGDALLHAIEQEFVEAVELLLEHEELIHKSGEPYSWQRVDSRIAEFTPDITPLILAAHKNNYEILKLLLDRGAVIPMPHDIRCGCKECLAWNEKDSLRHSMSRINAYRALASPSLIALSSTDPILTAFELSWELKQLASTEYEFRKEYHELRQQVQNFAVALLGQTRSSQELAVLLNFDPTAPPYEDGDHMHLARLEKAILYKQKKFVAHPNIQQLLSCLWYEGLPGFRRKSDFGKFIEIVRIAVLFPFYCLLYLIAPKSQTGQVMRKPFMKFLIHSSSYLFFLWLLILMSQRVEQLIADLIGVENLGDEMKRRLSVHRGNSPTVIEWAVLIYVFGFMWEETKELFLDGFKIYSRNMWNVVDFARNSMYIMTIFLRAVAYWQQQQEIAANPSAAFIPREEWHPYDPQLVSEGLCAAANVLSALKLVHMFSINPYLGPLQISLGRMVIDIIKFFFIYTLVLFAFACGMNQLLWYYAELTREACYSLPGGLPDWNDEEEACYAWRRFANLFESSQSLFWASFGLVGIEFFELRGIKSYTRFWGLLMFGCYSVINIVVLLNLLIAMMSHSFAVITERADCEWKFARAKLWMSYFEEGRTLPPPFNLIPTPKSIYRMFCCKKRKENQPIKEGGAPQNKSKPAGGSGPDHKELQQQGYMAVMRALVWRYITVQQRALDERGVTEDDISEVKTSISSFRCELVDILKENGMVIKDDGVAAKHGADMAGGRRARIWRRRIMRDFHVVPIAGEVECLTPFELETPKEKFKRAARMVMGKSQAVQQKWALIIKQATYLTQIGRTPLSKVLHRNSLQRAMQRADQHATVQLHDPSPTKNGDLRKHASPISPLIHSPRSRGMTLLDIVKAQEEAEQKFASEKEMYYGDDGQDLLDHSKLSWDMVYRTLENATKREDDISEKSENENDNVQKQASAPILVVTKTVDNSMKTPPSTPKSEIFKDIVEAAPVATEADYTDTLQAPPEMEAVRENGRPSITESTMKIPEHLKPAEFLLKEVKTEGQSEKLLSPTTTQVKSSVARLAKELEASLAFRSRKENVTTPESRLTEEEFKDEESRLGASKTPRPMLPPPPPPPMPCTPIVGRLLHSEPSTAAEGKSDIVSDVGGGPNVEQEHNVEQGPDVEQLFDVEGRPNVKSEHNVEGGPDVEQVLDVGGGPTVEQEHNVEGGPDVEQVLDVGGGPTVEQEHNVKGGPDVEQLFDVEGGPNVEPEHDVEGHYVELRSDIEQTLDAEREKSEENVTKLFEEKPEYNKSVLNGAAEKEQRILQIRNILNDDEEYVAETSHPPMVEYDSLSLPDRLQTSGYRRESCGSLQEVTVIRDSVDHVALAIGSPSPTQEENDSQSSRSPLIRDAEAASEESAGDQQGPLATFTTLTLERASSKKGKKKEATEDIVETLIPSTPTPSSTDDYNNWAQDDEGAGLWGHDEWL